MKQEKKNWGSSFLAGFLATVLGIALTFGVQELINSGKRARTARLLAEQIVEKMDRTYQDLHVYRDIYNSIDTTSMCLRLAIEADTLDRVDESIVEEFIENSLAEYVQADVDNGLDAYRSEILNTLGNVALIGHIDQFYSFARQYAKVSQQLIDQKRVVADLTYAHFYGNTDATWRDYVVFLYTLPEYSLFYSRMQNAFFPMDVGEKLMLEELNACKGLLQQKK